MQVYLCTEAICYTFVCRNVEDCCRDPVKGEAWRTIGVDLIGPLPETPKK